MVNRSPWELSTSKSRQHYKRKQPNENDNSLTRTGILTGLDTWIRSISRSMYPLFQRWRYFFSSQSLKYWFRLTWFPTIGKLQLAMKSIRNSNSCKCKMFTIRLEMVVVCNALQFSVPLQLRRMWRVYLSSLWARVSEHASFSHWPEILYYHSHQPVCQ
jgi:hypothetical protein